jgi:BASS family bile acid:Na+ symporter
MEQSNLTALFLPLALGIIMLGMGMTLTLSDFKRVFLYPKAILLGLGNQLLLLPLLGLAIISLFGLQAELAVGVMLLALCPGGATSNIITHLAKADLALSISLTALSSTITNFSIPFLLNMALFHYMGGAEAVQLPIGKTIVQIFAVTILPVSIGMLIKQYLPSLTAKSLKAVNIMSAVFFVLILLMAIIKERANIVPYFMEAGLPALFLNLVAMFAGYASGLFLALQFKQRVAIAIETGIQNGTLAIAIALSPVMLNNTQMAIPAAIYSLIMFLTASMLVLWSRNRADLDI